MNTIIVDENKIDSIFYHGYKWYDPPVIDDFCFDKFKILLPLWKLKCVVELMNGTKEGKMKQYCGETGETHFYVWNLETQEYFWNGKRVLGYDEMNNSDFDEQDLFSFFMAIENVLIPCHYIMTTNRERNISTKSVKSIAGKPEGVSRKDVKSKKVYLLDEIVEYVNENGLTIHPVGTHKMNCPCWSVRGHYRHYKSGKVVFIKNYEKGKEKGKKKPKEKIYTV